MNGRLIINKLIIDGPDYRRILPFRDGLNVINGDKTSGKSLVLTLINYCFGKSSKIELKVQRELGSKIDRVFVEFNIDEDTLTIKRNLKASTSKFSVFFTSFENRSMYTPKVLERSEFLELILLQFDIPRFKITKHKAHSNKKILEAISFRDIMRFVYINQHDFGTDNFLNYKVNSTRYKLGTTFEVITKLVKLDQNDLQNEKITIENQIREYESDIRGLKTYLKDKELSDIDIVDRKLDELEYEVKSYKKQKKALYSKVTEHKSESEELYTRIKSQILNTDNKLSNINNIIREINNSLAGKNNLIRNYEKDKIELEATMESLYKMKNIDHSLVCPICDSKVNFQNNNPKSIEIISKSVKKIEQRIKLVTELINTETNKVNHNNDKIEDLLQYRKILEKSIIEYERNIEAPYISEIEALNQLISNFNSQRNNVLEAKRLHNKIEEIDQLSKKSKKRLENIITQLQKFESSICYKKQLFDDLNDDYVAYMGRFKLKSNPEEVYINDKDYYPYYDDAIVFSHTSGGLLECMQIAYLTAIINRKISDTTINHPGFLMFDTLGKYLGTNRNDNDSIKDPQVYDEIYKVLIEVAKHIQVIVVDNTPPTIATQYIEYTFYDDGRGLVDLNINHREN